jgi:hypothetical protein
MRTAGAGPVRLAEPIIGGSLTSAMLTLSVAACVSFSFLSFPYGASWTDPTRPLGIRLAWLLSALQLPLGGLASVARLHLWQRRQQRLAAAGELTQTGGSQEWYRLLTSLVPEVQEHAVTVQLIGRGEPADLDPSCPCEPPSILLPGARRQVLRMPAASFARLLRDTRGLRAVVLHEIGHSVLRDARYLYGARFALTTFLPIQIVSVSLTVFATTLVDCTAAPCTVALLSALLGKSVLVAEAVQLAATLLLIPRLSELRERIADNFVVQRGGVAADLDRAVELLAGAAAPNAVERHRLKPVPLAWFFVVGFLVGAIKYSFVGTVFYLGGQFHGLELAQNLAAAGDFYVTFWFGVLLLSEPGTLPASVSENRYWMRASLYAFGVLAAYAVGQATPQLLLAAMPPGFDFVVRHDVPAVLFQTFCLDPIDALGVAAALICIGRQARRIAGLASLAVLMLWAWETWIRQVGGLATAYVITGVLLVACVAGLVQALGAAAVSRFESCSQLAVVALFLVAFGFGLHSPILPSVVALRLGESTLFGGAAQSALPRFRHAAILSPRMYAAYVRLGDAYSAMSRFDLAALAYEKALSVKTMSFWPDILHSRRGAAEAYLSLGRPSSLHRARLLLDGALAMRRQNSRLPPDEVSYALIVESEVITAIGKREELPLATFLLAEALALVPRRELQQEIKRMPEFSRLELQAGAAYIPAGLHFRGGEVPHFAEDLAVQLRTMPLKEQLAFGRLLVRSAVP